MKTLALFCLFLSFVSAYENEYGSASIFALISLVLIRINPPNK